ncbi:MAG TPA: permease-like cell division protein FtsX [Candidatus Goldiibacteriota bacterium]|nr:permease-like cell division protein FtsX [Candidatus Goldiibacteriota bacterium]HPN64986.1 permease-like cell division protein FtsX [Candidatus Goldiibacteriota bacterium]HRQ44693.1 permease-like cell division protein FtsX [Candidatus Goldiibacteriota bacterium]
MRLFREVVLNFKRSGFMSFVSIGTIILAVTMLGGFYIMQTVVNFAADQMQNRVEAVVFIKDGASAEEIKLLGDEITALSGVKEARYISKDDAYQDFAKDPEMQKILSSFEGNPLPDSISVKFNDYKAQEINSAVAAIKTKMAVEDVEYGAAEIEHLLNVINAVKYIAGAAGIIFVIAALLVVSNIIKLTIYNRRQDIYVLKMVGATGADIRLPFIFEGIAHGFLGGFLGWLILYAVVSFLAFQVKKETGIDLAAFYAFNPALLSPKFIFGMTGAGIVLGLTGSLMSQGRIFK